MSVYAGKPKREPCSSNCSTCDHKAYPDGGHCYMFREEPEGVCYSHTGLKAPFDILVSLIRSGHEFSRQRRTKGSQQT